MIVIVSPSKTQNVQHRLHENSQPLLLEHSAILIDLLTQFDKSELATLMKTSEKLTDATFEKIQAFQVPHTIDAAGTALATFQGDAFSAIDTDTYSEDDFIFANRHLRILSGLYGLLRPLDLMQPYRLEMGSKLASDRGKNLYEFWGTIITDAINDELIKMENQVVINCASLEYSRVIKKSLLTGSMISIQFKQRKNNNLKSIAIYAKRARGMFVDYMIRNRICEIDQLRFFSDAGYQFSNKHSGDTELVFITTLD